MLENTEKTSTSLWLQHKLFPVQDSPPMGTDISPGDFP